MRVLHIVSSYVPAFKMGGPIESVHSLNKSLTQKKVDITVYTTNAGIEKQIEFNKEIPMDGVKVFYFPYYGYVHFTFSPALCWAIRKNIKNFDLIHITGVWNFPCIVAAFWARFYKKPYIISPRGSLMKEPLIKKSPLKKRIFLKFFVKRDLGNASALHFTVEKEKEEYIKAGLPMKNAIVIPNGIDLGASDVLNTSDVQKLNFRQKFNIPSDAKIVLFLSRLNWKKGLDTLIPAFAEVVKKEPKAVLVLAGPDENDYAKNLKSQISNLKINDKVLFTGMLIGEDKIAAYRESDVFVLPSYSENFGMVVIEAMFYELPVVITKGVGISGEVEKAGAGIVVDKDVIQLTSAILKILNNPALAKKIGEAGKKLVEKEFSSEKVAERWVGEYNNLITNNYEASSYRHNFNL